MTVILCYSLPPIVVINATLLLYIEHVDRPKQLEISAAKPTKKFMCNIKIRLKAGDDENK